MEVSQRLELHISRADHNIVGVASSLGDLLDGTHLIVGANISPVAFEVHFAISITKSFTDCIVDIVQGGGLH